MYVLKGDIVDVKEHPDLYAPMTDVVMNQDCDLSSWEKAEVLITSGRSVMVYPASIVPREVRYDAHDFEVAGDMARITFDDKWDAMELNDSPEVCDD